MLLELFFKGECKLKVCFSKKLLIADYVVLILLVMAFMIFTLKGYETTNCITVIGAWIAQIAVSSGFYYWKAKAENLIKMPLQLLDGLSQDMKEKADPNMIIQTVIGMKD